MGTYVAAALIVFASLVTGRAFLGVLGARGRSWLAPAAGFAVLLIAARLAIRLPGRSTTALIVVLALIAGSLVWLALGTPGSRRPLGARPAGDLLVPAAVALLVLAAVSIPFLANDRIGVLGVGRQSDLQAHVYAADYLTHRVGFGPDAIANGYPLGPHALVATVARLTGAGTAQSFVGLVLAIPLLAAWTALAALGELSPLRRIVAATLVGLPYLAASFLAEGTFKETAEGLYLLAFALGLRELGGETGPDREGRWAIAAMLVALAGASVYTYSYPGLVWPAAALAIWGTLQVLGGWRPPRAASWPRPSRGVAIALVLGLVAVAAIALPELRRAADFREVVSQVQDTKGRLRAPVSPAQALGLWPAGNFRLDPEDAALATAMSLAALGALAFGLLWWVRRREIAVVAAFAAGALVYLEARRRSGLYIEAKSLAVLAPLPMLISLRALLSAGRWRAFAGAAICVGAAFASFLALRAAPVGPSEHAGELARLRPLVAGHRVLFLGSDRLSSHELRGAYVRQGNLLASKHARPTKPWTPERALDFDSIPSRRLNRFDFAITTTAAFASAPPAGFRRVASTRDYALWRRTGRTPDRETLFEPSSIGGRLDCSRPDHAALARRQGRAAVLPGPRVGRREAWKPGRFFDAGEAVEQTLPLGGGTWRLSLQYHSPVALTMSAAGTRVTLPPSLDGKVPYFEGGGPFWPAGSVNTHGDVTVTVRAARLDGVQRMLGVRRRIALGALAATRAAGGDGARIVPLSRACGKFVDWYELGGSRRAVG
jgi:hypothetical protein